MNQSSHVAAVALGANLGDRAATLRSAIAALSSVSGVRDLRVSSFHATAPVVPGEARPDQPEYLNAAARFVTTLTPRMVLNELQRIEREHGRVRIAAERWAPRTLDLDLLFFGEEIIDEPGLTIPHPRLHERAFVLAPLVEVAPDLRHPILGLTVQQLHDRVTRSQTLS